MNLNEAILELKEHGYICEKFDIDLNYNGPRGSAILTINGKKFTANDFPNGTKDTNWKHLRDAIVRFKTYYPKWQKYVDMDVSELSNYMSDFWKLTQELEKCQNIINYNLKSAKIDADIGESALNTYSIRKDEVIKYNKKLVENETNAKLEERNGKVNDHVLCFPNFERAITLNVDWVKGTFYQWSGLCVFVSLSQIKGLTKNRSNGSSNYYDLTADNLNKIEQWFNDNEDYIRKEMKRGSDHFDDVAKDQARYYKSHPNGNWSGD